MERCSTEESQGVGAGRCGPPDFASVSAFKAESQGHQGSHFISENYTIRDKFMHKILQFWQVQPEVDGFACKNSARFPRFWGPDSDEEKDAFQQFWGDKFLWLNPPFSMLKRVVEKLWRTKHMGF